MLSIISIIRTPGGSPVAAALRSVGFALIRAIRVQELSKPTVRKPFAPPSRQPFVCSTRRSPAPKGTPPRRSPALKGTSLGRWRQCTA